MQDNGNQGETLLSAESQSERTSRVASRPPYKSLKEFIEAQKGSRSRQSSQTRTFDTRTRSPRFFYLFQHTSGVQASCAQNTYRLY